MGLGATVGLSWSGCRGKQKSSQGADARRAVRHSHSAVQAALRRSLLARTVATKPRAFSQCLGRGDYKEASLAAQEGRFRAGNASAEDSDRLSDARPLRLYLNAPRSHAAPPSRRPVRAPFLIRPASVRLKTPLDTLKGHGVSCRQISPAPYLRALSNRRSRPNGFGIKTVVPCAWLEPHGAFEDYSWQSLKEDTLLGRTRTDLSELCSFLLSGERSPPASLSLPSRRRCRLPGATASQAYKLLWLLNPRESRAGSARSFLRASEPR